MPYDALILLIPALPIVGFVFAAVFGRRLQARYGRNAASLVPVALVVISWIAAMIVVIPAIEDEARAPLRQALLHFGDHLVGCEYGPAVPCTCGWYDAIRGTVQ